MSQLKDVYLNFSKLNRIIFVEYHNEHEAQFQLACDLNSLLGHIRCSFGDLPQQKKVSAIGFSFFHAICAI